VLLIGYSDFNNFGKKHKVKSADVLSWYKKISELQTTYYTLDKTPIQKAAIKKQVHDMIVQYINQTLQHSTQA
jgi:hypothetical protein